MDRESIVATQGLVASKIYRVIQNGKSFISLLKEPKHANTQTRTEHTRAHKHTHIHMRVHEHTHTHSYRTIWRCYAVNGRITAAVHVSRTITHELAKAYVHLNFYLLLFNLKISKLLNLEICTFPSENTHANFTYT